MAATANDGNDEITPEIVKQYRHENPKGISKTGISYWLIMRIHFGGAPIIGAPPLPALERSLSDDTALIGRRPE